MDSVALVSGPTGGHLLPALLTAKQFHRKNVLPTVFSTTSSESPLLSEYDGEYSRLKFNSWPGNNFTGKLSAYKELGLNFARFFSRITTYDALVSFGGYPAVPLIVAAALRGVPIFLQEQNRLPGKTTVLFSSFAERIFYGLPPIKQGSEARWDVVGNPLRDLTPVDERWFNEAPLLVVVGGSQGSRELSRNLAGAADRFFTAGWHIYYVQGKFGLDLTEEIEASEQFRQSQFDPELPSKLACADCVWGRAGAGTISELVAAETPAVLFPFRAAADSHQRFNAEWLVTAGPAALAANRSPEELVRLTFNLAEADVGYELPELPRAAAETVIVQKVLEDL